MLSNVFAEGSSFRKTCSYLCEDHTRAQVLYAEGVRDYDHHLMALDFKMISDQHPGREKPVFHSVLDFHKDEKPDDARLVEIGRKYLEKMGYGNAQYILAKHVDTAHLHVHVLANRIGYDGKYIENHQEIIRSRKAVKELVNEYQLIPAERKNLKNTNLQALSGADARRYAVYQFITSALPYCRNLEQLEYNLQREGVEMRLFFDPQTGARKGISFRYRGLAFKGSQVDRAFSLYRLEKSLGLSQELTPWEQEKLTRQYEQQLEQQQKRELALQQKQLHQEKRELPIQRRRIGHDEDHSHSHHYSL